LRDKYYKKGF